MILWRDTVTAGEFSVAYSKTGEAWGDYRLQMPDGSFWALPSCSPSVGASTQFDDLYCRQFMVPVTVPAGVYPISRGVPGQYYDAGTITVAAKPAAKKYRTSNRAITGSRFSLQLTPVKKCDCCQGCTSGRIKSTCGKAR